MKYRNEFSIADILDMPIDRAAEIFKDFPKMVKKLDPLNANAYNNLGNLLKKLKRYSEADAAYRKATELKSS